MSTLLRRRGDASSTAVLMIVCAGVVLASLDLFIVNVALPSMGRDLHTADLGDLSWVLNAYAIVYAALLVLLGRLSEGRRRENAFLLGVAVFTLASAACGAATDLTMLVAFRVLQAVGAALLTPTSLGLILATAPADKRQSSVRAWTAIGGVAAALGPVVGGLLVGLSWRWVFYVNVPIGLAAIVIGWRRLPVVAGHPVPRPDAFAALLITAGVAALTLGLVKGGGWGWGSAATLGALAGAVLALAAFALHCARHRNPLIDGRLFRARPFTGSSLVSLAFSVAFGAMLFSRVLFAQDVWHWSALTTGLSIAPGPLMVPGLRVRRRRPRDPPLRARSGHRDGLARLRRRRRVVDTRGHDLAPLRQRHARRDPAHRRRRRAHPADLHGHRDRRAAAGVVRDRLGRDQHAAPARDGDRGRAARRRTRDAPRRGSDAHRLPPRLGADRRRGGAGGADRGRRAAAPPPS